MENDVKGLKPLSAESAQEIAEDYEHPPGQFLRQRATQQPFYSAWNAVKTPQPEPPGEILECARKLELWMKQNGHQHWQLLGVCDRSFAIRLEKINELINWPPQ